jgi:hypothetical protein
MDRLNPTRDFSQGAEAAPLIITNKADNGKENKAAR